MAGAPAERAPHPAVSGAALHPLLVSRGQGMEHERDRIAALESAAAGWAARNPTSGALGRYQFVPVALQDIGWRDASGGWTDRAATHGVTSEDAFLAPPPGAQEAAVAAYLGRPVLTTRPDDAARPWVPINGVLMGPDAGRAA